MALESIKDKQFPVFAGKIWPSKENERKRIQCFQAV
jgi:hypothetical protein